MFLKIEVLVDYVVEVIFCLGLQVWEAIGAKNVFRSAECHDVLRQHSAEVRGVTLANLSGDHVFNAIFTERKYSSMRLWMAFVALNVHTDTKTHAP